MTGMIFPASCAVLELSRKVQPLKLLLAGLSVSFLASLLILAELQSENTKLRADVNKLGKKVSDLDRSANTGGNK